ncbi:MAG TPA: hypothetical protein GX712_08095 [Bacteroidales bacterium]|nr:hypothetical protein [Bacteroidales bacterium]
MNKFIYQFFFLLIVASSLFFISCEEEKIITDDPEIVLTSFSFLSDNNKSLSQEYNAIITDGQIEVTIKSITKNLIATFETNASKVTVNGVEQISNVTLNDFSKTITYNLVSENGNTKSYTIRINWTSPIAHISVTTDQNASINSKDTYINANIDITANGWGEDYTGRTRIRGRGNSTWGLPKKPYRLKLDDDAVILGMAKEKDWVLLANYLDPTLMLNAVAFKIGNLLELPYTNNSIPVDLTINGKYAGSYMLTEQVERSKSRVNIHKEKGVLLELDTNYDEDYQFHSNNYRLPVMVKDPDLKDDFSPEDAEVMFDKIKSDFHQLEDAIASDEFPNSNYKDYIDVESLVKYLIVYNLTHNMEINHPKSTYMHKDETGKYFMGPIWDFDWAFDYEGTHIHFGSYNKPLFGRLGSSSTGYTFFTRIMEDPEIKELYKTIWGQFRADSMDALLEYVDFYSSHIIQSHSDDYQVWSKTPNFSGTSNYSYKINQLKSWLTNRADYIDRYVNDF